MQGSIAQPLDICQVGYLMSTAEQTSSSHQGGCHLKLDVSQLGTCLKTTYSVSLIQKLCFIESSIRQLALAEKKSSFLIGSKLISAPRGFSSPKSIEPNITKLSRHQALLLVTAKLRVLLYRGVENKTETYYGKSGYRFVHLTISIITGSNKYKSEV